MRIELIPAPAQRINILAWENKELVSPYIRMGTIQYHIAQVPRHNSFELTPKIIRTLAQRARPTKYGYVEFEMQKGNYYTQQWVKFACPQMEFYALMTGDYKHLILDGVSDVDRLGLELLAYDDEIGLSSMPKTEAERIARIAYQRIYPLDIALQEEFKRWFT